MEELTASEPSPAPQTLRSAAPFRHARAVYALLLRTGRSVLAHDALNLAQSSAYSAIVALFPALIVAAAIIALIPDTAPIRTQLADFFDRILPPGVSPLLDAYFQNAPANDHSIRALTGAAIVSFLGASNVMITLMEGLRRAQNLPPDCWTFWQRRRRGFELVPLSLLPLAAASLLVLFGHAVTVWLAAHFGSDLRGLVYAAASLLRWAVALSASIGLIALVYHLGVPERRIRLRSPGRAWVRALPGAILATGMWLLTTLAFGWYVTRFAHYSQVYGSLGTGIALLFWLYIVSLSVLCGAEFNAQLAALRTTTAST